MFSIKIGKIMNKVKINVIIYIAIFLVMMFTIIFYTKNGLSISKLNNMYKDIEVLEDQVSVFYINNNNLPIRNDVIDFKNSINPNDNDIFYEIDLEKLENINLSYGNKKNGNNDIYIINEQSHTIYYLEGILYNNERIYTKKVDYKYVDLEKF